MNTFLTSDCHFGHTNILKYCKRPFKNVEHMNNSIINNWNSRVKSNDIVFHLGDFCFNGGVEGSNIKGYEWEKKLNGKIIHVRGNHDKNNSIKSPLCSAIIEFAGLNIMLIHIPPHRDEETPDFCNLVLCGHVHEKWKYQYNENIRVPVINVGVDQWKFMPMKINEIVDFYYKIIKKGQFND